MGQTMPRVSAVGAVGGSVIKVKWKDRSSDRIDLSGWIATGDDILAPLREAEIFKSPRVSEYGASVAWGDDDDLRIDAVHLEQIAAEQRPFGARDAAAWQKAMALSNSEAADLLGISVSTWNAYKAGASIPSAIAMLCRAARRDPILMQAHYRPRRAGRPRKSA
jgi:type IV secretory pathway TrbD component